MKRINQGVFWAVFLILAGLFLLFKNLAFFGPWGDLIWGGLFSLAGLAFLLGFLGSTERWWRAIPAFTLLGLGIPLLLVQWRQVDLGQWQSGLVLLGVALGFWVVLVVRPENWWAEIPAGVLTLLGIMIGLQDRLQSTTQWLIVFTIGLGLVFALLYVLRARERGGWWPAVPAAGLILFGVVTWIGPASAVPAAARWWPVLLLVAGLVVLVFSLQRLPSPQRVRAGGTARPGPAPDYDAVRPAPGASVTQVVPEADLPSPPEQPPVTPPSGSPVTPGEEPDIYEFLKNQPPEPGS